MAHQSGYGGKITWDQNSENAPPWNLTIQSWVLQYSQRQYETPVMGYLLRTQGWPTVTLGIAEWTADAVYLIADTFNSAVGGGLQIGLEVLIHLRLNYSGPGTSDRFVGTGITQTGTVNVPLDGPITGRTIIRGIGQLIHESVL